jgi:hypothetical protein
MLKQMLVAVTAAMLVMLVWSSRAEAYGAVHVGVTRVGPYGGVYHSGATRVGGVGYGGVGVYRGAYGYGGYPAVSSYGVYRSGYGGVGYGGVYSGLGSPYVSSYYSGYSYVPSYYYGTTNYGYFP